MTFPSLTFLLFFVVVFAATRAPVAWTWRKAFLLVASYFFYAVWNPPFVALLWISTAVDWTLAKRLHQESRQGRRKALLVVSLVVNLGMLGFFKYAGFLTESLSSLVGWLGGQADFSAPSLVLPVGISFYTFQTLSYTLDVYRRRLVPNAPLLDYALYVTFFPQLVAGPIVRARHFLPQCAEERTASRDQIGWGLTLLTLGLFQKSVIADALLAPVVDRVFGAGAQVTPGDAWLGTFAFAGQIFYDFSGYTACALGVALALGFHLPDNFRSPYASVGFSDFWRRWHISLSSWLRDYLYIPLGGSHHGALRTAIALAATMLLGGLWHGASWTFVVWGALHGLFLVVERAVKQVAGEVDTSALPLRLLLTLVTFLAVCVAWVFFRADSLEHALALLRVMSSPSPALLPAAAVVTSTLVPWQVGLVVVVTLAMLGSHQLLRTQTLEQFSARLPPPLRAAWVGLMLFFIGVTPGSNDAFLYFQF